MTANSSMYLAFEDHLCFKSQICQFALQCIYPFYKLPREFRCQYDFEISILQKTLAGENLKSSEQARMVWFLAEK